MPVRDEGQGGTSWSPELVVTDWRRALVIMPKRTASGTLIKPFTMAYTREREAYDSGQRLLFTDWLTEPDYLMMILKAEH